MATGAWLSDTPRFLNGPHGHVLRARATHPAFEAPVELDVVNASVGWDESRSPEVQATMTVALTGVTADMLDPRTGVRVELDVGYRRPDGVEDVQPFVDLGVRRASENQPGGAITLDLASDEALLIDGSPAAGFGLTNASTAGAIIALVNQVVSPRPRFFVAAQSGPAVSVNPVTDRWETIRDLADQQNCRVYDDGLRGWVYDNRAITVGPINVPADVALVAGEGGTLLETESVADRGEWANYAFLRYVWFNASNVPQQITATAFVASGPFYINGPAGKVIYIEEREVPTTQAAANTAAANVLRRRLADARSMTLTSIAQYWVRPGMTIDVTLLGGTRRRHLVGAVDFDPLNGTMRVTTRLPEDSVFDTTTPDGGSKVPDPDPPAKQTFVSSWVANDGGTYRGDGTKRADTTDMVQGFNSANGNGTGLAIFTAANSTGGETGVTVTTALTGATISKVEVFLYANHWNSFAGGTARIGAKAVTVVPSTMGAGSPYVTSSAWPRGTGRWVNITNGSLVAGLLNGTIRGVTVGPGVGSNLAYYGRFNGAAAGSNRPILRITYAK